MECLQVLRVACLTWNQALGSASSRPAWWPEHLPRCAPPAGALLHPPNSQVAGLRGLRHIPRHHRRLAALLRLHRLHWAGSCQRRRARAAAADSAGRAHHARRAAAAVGGLHAGWGWAHRPGSANSRDERVGAAAWGRGGKQAHDGRNLLNAQLQPDCQHGGCESSRCCIATGAPFSWRSMPSQTCRPRTVQAGGPARRCAAGCAPRGAVQHLPPAR